MSNKINKSNMANQINLLNIFETSKYLDKTKQEEFIKTVIQQINNQLNQLNQINKSNSFNIDLLDQIDMLVNKHDGLFDLICQNNMMNIATGLARKFPNKYFVSTNISATVILDYAYENNNITGKSLHQTNPFKLIYSTIPSDYSTKQTDLISNKTWWKWNISVVNTNTNACADADADVDVSVNQICKNCPICFEESTNLVKTRCNHIFCKKCMHNYLILKHNCPLCRQNIY